MFLEVRDLGCREWLRRQIGQRRPAPQDQRPAHRRRGHLGLSGRDRVAPLLDLTLESLEIQLSRTDAQAVSGRGGGDLRLVSECLPQPRDVHPDRLDGVTGRVLAPERHHETLCADRLVAGEQEHRQDRARLDASEGQRRSVIVANFKRPEEAELHRVPATLLPADAARRRGAHRSKRVADYRCLPAGREVRMPTYEEAGALAAGLYLP